jgi:hypothetical protein
MMLGEVKNAAAHENEDPREAEEEQGVDSGRAVHEPMGVGGRKKVARRPTTGNASVTAPLRRWAAASGEEPVTTVAIYVPSHSLHAATRFGRSFVFSQAVRKLPHSWLCPKLTDTTTGQ